MKERSVPTVCSNTLVVVSRAEIDVVPDFIFGRAVPLSKIIVQRTDGPEKKVASTYSNVGNDKIHVLPSSTVSQWRRVARLARIAINEDEISELCAQLNSIMSFVTQISSVNVDGVEPMTSVTPMTMKTRKDEVTDGGIPDAIIANAPAHEHHFFLVPKVVE